SWSACRRAPTTTSRRRTPDGSAPRAVAVTAGLRGAPCQAAAVVGELRGGASGGRRRGSCRGGRLRRLRWGARARGARRTRFALLRRAALSHAARVGLWKRPCCACPPPRALCSSPPRKSPRRRLPAAASLRSRTALQTARAPRLHRQRCLRPRRNDIPGL